MRHYNQLLLYICLTLSSADDSIPKLTPETRTKLHTEGYCLKACNFASERSDNDADRPANILNSNFRYKSMKEFHDLLARYEELRDDIEGNKDDLLSVDDIDDYCKENDLSLEVCVQSIRESLIYEQAMQCYKRCNLKVHTRESVPTYEDSSPIFQDLEKCLDELSPLEFEFEGLDVEKAVETYKKQGFVVLENVFDEETMNQMTNILNSWRKVGKWEDFTYNKFVYDEHIPTNANRFEVILPYHEPFSILFYKLHNALKGFMAQLSEKPKLKSFSAYGSLPGAIESTYKKLKMSDANMLKASIILQPQTHRVLCPCTHQNSHLFSFFTYNVSCPIKYDSFKAGSVVLFDPLLKYFETDHDGSFVRWNVDAMYVFGEVELLDYLEGDDAMAVQKKKKNRKHVEKYHSEYL